MLGIGVFLFINSFHKISGHSVEILLPELDNFKQMIIDCLAK